MELRDNILISGSYNGTAALCDLNTQKCIGDLKGHTEPLRGIMFDSEKIITASLDQTLKIWDNKTNKLISTISTKQSNSCLYFVGSKLFVGTLEGQMLWYDIPQRYIKIYCKL